MSHVLYLLSFAIHNPINYGFMALYSEKGGNLPQVTQPADGKARILTEPAHQAVPLFCFLHYAKGARVGRVRSATPISMTWFLHLLYKKYGPNRCLERRFVTCCVIIS